MEDFKQGEVLWREVSRGVRGELSGAVFDTWLRDSRCLGFDGKVLKLGVRNAFVREWIERRLFSRLERALAEVAEGRGLGRVKLSLQLLSAEEPAEQYTFEQFIVGVGNHLAYQTAREVAKHPGEKFNPLYLYSEPGLGKTHLLRAITHTSRENHFRPLYIRAERFMEEFIFSARNGRGYQFRERFRCSDILLLDDLHFLCDKVKTINSFLYIVKELIEEGKQVVISALFPPQKLPLPEGLSYCLLGGVVLPIHSPDRELRLNFLKAKAHQLQLPLSNELLNELADKEAKNFTMLLGYLNQMMFGYSTFQEPQPRAEQIAKAVARYFMLSGETLFSKSRQPQVSLARAILIYLWREELSMTFSQIAQELNLSKSSVIYCWQKISRTLDQPSTQKALHRIKEFIEKPA